MQGFRRHMGAAPAIATAVVVLCTQLMAFDATVNAFGDDTLDVWVNGTAVTVSDQLTASVTLDEGVNVVAAKLSNPQWGGNLMLSLPLPGGETIVSDSSWSCSYHEPADDSWKEAGFSSANWFAAHDFGPIPDWPGYPENETELSELVADNARMIYGSAKNYFRATFSSETALEGEFRIRGANFTAKIWLNGEVLHETGTSFYECTDAPEASCLLRWAHRVPCSIQAGTNVLAIEIEDMVGKGSGAFFKVGVFDGELRDCDFDDFSSITVQECHDLRRADGTLPLMISGRMGTLKVSSMAPEGWTATSFDDAGWAEATYQTTFDSQHGVGDGLSGAMWTWPSELWFRKEFVLDASGSVSTLQSPAGRSIVPRALPAEFFSLDGRKIQHGRQAPKGIILQRTVNGNEVRCLMRGVR